MKLLEAGDARANEAAVTYLEGRERSPKGDDFAAAVARWSTLKSDDGATYDESVTLDASNLKPMINSRILSFLIFLILCILSLSFSLLLVLLGLFLVLLGLFLALGLSSSTDPQSLSSERRKRIKNEQSERIELGLNITPVMQRELGMLYLGMIAFLLAVHHSDSNCSLRAQYR